MTVIRRRERMPDPDWDAFVTAHPDGTLCHLSTWAVVAETVYGWTPYYLAAEADRVITGVVPLVHVRHGFGRGTLVSAPFCVYGGALARDSATANALDKAAADLARELNVTALEMRQRERANPAWVGTDLYATFRKQLEPDPASNLAAVPRKQRAMIRKGEKAGLSIRRGRDVATFYRLFCAGMRNLGTPVYPRRLFTTLAECFGDRFEILLVEHEGQVVSAVLSLYFRDEVLPYYAGGIPAARQLAAFDYMYWRLMEQACTDGLRIFDFGRSMRNTGAYAFKKNWGFEPQPLHYQFHMIGSGAPPVLDPERPLYRCLAATWRCLPLPVANLAGPLVARVLY